MDGKFSLTKDILVPRIWSIFLAFFANTTPINYFVNSMSLNRLFSIRFSENELFFDTEFTSTTTVEID